MFGWKGNDDLMKIVEAKRFYEQDGKDYVLKENRGFLCWYQEKINEGYHDFIDVSSLQDLINGLVVWYEIKYPEREFRAQTGMKDNESILTDGLAEHMNLEQLLLRLSQEQLDLLKGGIESVLLRLKGIMTLIKNLIRNIGVGLM